MIRVVLFILAGFLISCVAQKPSSEQLPDDVQSFVDRREMCDYFRGEIPDPIDVDRMKAVEDGIDRYCASTDQELAGLKRKYSNHTWIMSKLNGYEERIEAVSE